MLNVISWSSIVFVSLVLLTYASILIEDKIRMKKKIKWAKEFMKKVEKFQI